jgi:hypothetical protein
MSEYHYNPLDDLSYYFVMQEILPDGTTQLALSSSAAWSETRKTLPFDSEEDTALHLLAELRKGARASEEHIAIAKAILRGEKPMFVHEQKQPDGTLLLSFHGDLPPRDAGIRAFGCRSHRWLARFLLRRLKESSHVTASAETVRQAQALLG